MNNSSLFLFIMKVLQMCVLCLFNTFVIGQTLNLKIINSDKSKVSVYQNSNDLNYNGKELNISIQPLDTITIFRDDFIDTSFVLDRNISEDTMKMTIRLDNKRTQIYQGITISAKRNNEVYKNKNEFIIDYIPLPMNRVLFLSKRNGSKSLFIYDLINGEIFDMIIPNDADEILQGALGKFYIKYKNYYQHFYLDSNKVHLLEKIDNEIYNANLLNLITCTQNECLFKNLSLHNKIYSLHSIGVKEKTVFQYYEAEAISFAQKEYESVVLWYMKKVPAERNIIMQGAWNGDIMQLVDTHSEINLSPDKSGIITSTSGWYKNIASSTINITTFGLLESLIVLNGENDSIIHINYESLNITKEIPSEIHLTGDYFFDYFYDHIYMTVETKGTKQVYKLNVNTGNSELIADLSEIHQPRNIKVINDKVYVLVLDKNGFNRLLRVN